MTLICPGKLVMSSSDVGVSNSSRLKAASDYIALRSTAGIEYPLRLYILNEIDAKRGAEPKVVFDSADKNKIRNTDIQAALVREGTKCICYHDGKEYSREEFKKITSSGSPVPQYSKDFGLKPTGTEKAPFREPDIRLAMSAEIWSEIGIRAGWIKSAQAYNPIQVQQNVDNAAQQQQQYADAAKSAQQELAQLRQDERALLERQKSLQAQIRALQTPGKSQEQMVKETQALNAELSSIESDLKERQDQIKKYDEIGAALQSAKNPQLAEGLRLA